MDAVMPLDSLFTNPNPQVERSRSILSRFSNPLSKRTAKFFDLEIEPEHPHKTYRPGDIVKGKVVLSVFKGFDITHLTILLHGYARVFKHQVSPREAKTTPEQLVNGKGPRGFEYFGNGLASLFQDEQTLCGSGFLKKHTYKFEFELQFPEYSLPSTIEFERGAVNYMITATLTRPTTITPTTNRMYIVKFEDRVDIESMYTPKSRAIYLEPMTRRGKVKKVKRSSASNTQESTSTKTLSRQNTSHSAHTPSSSAPLNETPRSPAPSENTVATDTTDSAQSLDIVENDSAQRKQSDPSGPASSTTSNSAHTISAVTEIQRHGALPGDLIPVRVKVEHTKAVRGIIIATLYRLGRIDMLPALPLANRTKDKKAEYEDVYPKSRTGLGGLYFTNGAPNMVFKKDLTQTSTIMIVDPQTKTADVNFKVKIPDEAFPTMDNIPGGMISFTYHIEVVIDLTGKLGESRLLPSLTTNGPSFSNAVGGGHNQLTHEWANNILDTAPLRRTKNVAAFELPVVIGTEDTGRSKRLKDQQLNPQPRSSSNGKQSASPQPHHQGYNYNYEPNGYENQTQDYDQHGNMAYDEGWYDEFGNPIYDGWYDQYHYPHQPAPHSMNGYHHPLTNGTLHVPPPQDEEHPDEKSRLKWQEGLLVPSAPPEAEGSANQARSLAPSAPIFDDHAPRSAQPSIPITISRASARSAETIVRDPLTPPPSLPEDSLSLVTEDKQELERKRLAAQASAPPDNDDDDNAGPSSSRSAADAPSAPVINDEAEYIAQALPREGSESLPQYQR